ncbi:hypothetical protein SP39_22 [Salmonella phage 39]|nr:hypothetical protein SP39_22 [Salmonella phage 39]
MYGHESIWMPNFNISGYVHNMHVFYAGCVRHTIPSNMAV